MDNGNLATEDGQQIHLAGQIRERVKPESVIRVALDVLAVRVARWTSLVMSFALFGAAAWWPDWKRLAAAGGFALVIHAPMWWKRDR